MARKPSPEGRASILRDRRREAERRGGLPPRPADPAEGASRGGRSRLRRRAGRGPPRGASCERELRGGQGGGAEACPQTLRRRRRRRRRPTPPRPVPIPA